MRKDAWTPEHSEAAARSHTYEEFAALIHPEVRSRRTWVNRRYLLRRQGVKVVTADVPIGGSPMPDMPPSDDEPSSPLIDLDPPDEDANEEVWFEYLGHMEKAALAYQRIETDNRIIRWEATDNKPVAIAFMGDQHIGNVNTRYDLLNRDVALLTEMRDYGVLAVGMGDAIDNFNVVGKSKTGTYNDMTGPMAQVKWAISKLKGPNWIAWLKGNHEGMSGVVGLDVAPHIAEQLGAKYVGEAGCALHITVGFQRYVIYAKHQWAGVSGLNRGNAARRMYDDFPWERERADLVALGHTHENHLEVPTRNGEPVTYLRSGTFKLKDEWGEAKGYRATYGVPMVVLYPDERRIIPYAGSEFLEAMHIFRDIRRRWA